MFGGLGVRVVWGSGGLGVGGIGVGGVGGLGRGVGDVRGVQCWGVKGLGSWGVWRGFKGVGVGYWGIRGWGWFKRTL